MYLTKFGTIYDQQSSLDFIFQALLDGGWTVFDDISASDKVFTTMGETVKNIPLFARIYIWNSSYINVELYPHWNNTTHVGTHQIRLFNTIGRPFSSYPAVTNVANAFAVVTKDYLFIAFTCYISGTVAWTTSMAFGYIPEVLCSMKYTAATPIVAGANVSIQLDNLDYIQFDTKYQIIDRTGKTGCEPVRVNNVDTATSTITVDSIVGDYPDGIYFGYNVYPIFYSSGPILNSIIPLKKIGTATSEAALQFNDILWGYNDSDSPSLSTMFSNPISLLNRCVAKEQNEIIPIGHFGDNIRSCRGAVLRVINKSVIIFNNNNQLGSRSYPTSIADDFSSITDVRYTFPINSLVGKFVVILSGYGAGQSRKIISNTETTIVVEHVFIDAINKTSQYTIVDNVFRCLLRYGGPSSPNFYVRDVY